ncbi:transposase [Glaesserella parasuis]|uniref:transposase n=2 Tax=Glaesserella parasuis TaxID=738 RepID=UPI0024371F51|nr:transposase [Glaesserella parasuis]MDG6765356.1 transposase [Glaesserella parasuis]
MRRPRRTFSAEFKAEAVKLITERKYSITQACKELDIGETALRRRVSQVQAEYLRLKSRSFLRQVVNPPASEPFNQV